MNKIDRRTVDYRKYIGHYVKRFYAPFEKESISKIKDWKPVDEYGRTFDGMGFFLYDNGIDDEAWWGDVEDSCVITNEVPEQEIEWVANVNNESYLKEYYNPFINE